MHQYVALFKVRARNLCIREVNNNVLGKVEQLLHEAPERALSMRVPW